MPGPAGRSRRVVRLAERRVPREAAAVCRGHMRVALPPLGVRTAPRNVSTRLNVFPTVVFAGTCMLLHVAGPPDTMLEECTEGWACWKGSPNARPTGEAPMTVSDKYKHPRGPTCWAGPFCLVQASHVGAAAATAKAASGLPSASGHHKGGACPGSHRDRVTDMFPSAPPAGDRAGLRRTPVV